DANLDGVVNALDFNALASNFGAPGAKLWFEGDFNYNGTVNTQDFTALASNFNLVLPSALPGALVPEPASTGLLIGFAAWSLKRSRYARLPFCYSARARRSSG